MGRLVRLNLVDINFKGAESACHGKAPRIVDWRREGEHVPGVPTIFTDFTIGTARAGVPNQYAWLLESPVTKRGIIGRGLLREVGVDRFQAVFTSERKLVAENPEKFRYAPVGGIWVREPYIRPNKSKLVSMIASTKAFTEQQRERNRLAELFADRVDVFGRGRARELAIKEDALDEYMFSLANENVCAEGYWTEKLLDCFATGTVPIYKGAPDIGRYFDERGILQLSMFEGAFVRGVPGALSPALHEKMKPYIVANFHEALRYEIPEDRLVVDHFSHLL